MDQRAIVVGISGCSSSGKTTLARLLRDIFPGTFILHEDDFYKAESELPIKDGLVDWDCPEAISFPDLEAALTHVRSTGTFPPTLDSKEDLNSVGPCPATPAQIASCAAAVRHWLSPGQPGSLIFSNKNNLKLCLLDGFLLYTPTTPSLSDSQSHDPPPQPQPSSQRTVSTQIDIKLLLRTSRAAAIARRAARDGYVTLEGFWKDPPGYVEKIVWPNYVASHAWLFEGGVVEGGRLDRGGLKREGIHALLSGDDGKEEEDVEFGEVLEWAVKVVMAELERIVLGGRDGEGVNE